MTNPDYTAMLNIIRAEPTCDAPRLVVADWLEEHGEQKRGEFIRAQCEIPLLAKALDGCWWCDDGRMLPVCASCIRNRERWIPLCQREQELEKQCWQEWTEVFAPLIACHHDERNTLAPNHIGISFHRGLITKVHCSLANWYGGTCSFCCGQGRTTDYNAFAIDAPICSECCGDGYINGYGPTIIRAPICVIERVICNNTPVMTIPFGGFCWRKTDYINNSYGIIGPLFDYLVYGKLDSTKTIRRYDTIDAAKADLSTAMIRWAWSDKSQSVCEKK